MMSAAVRGVLLLIAGVLLAGGGALAMLGAVPAAVGLTAWGLILIVGLVIERWRYKPLAERSPGPDWTLTDERFVDPETGKLVTVYYHPATGERRYVAVP
jgi:hypothetical protein